MTFKRFLEKLNENWLVCLLNFVVITIGVLLGDYCARTLSKVSSDKSRTDTVYIEKSKTDSLLQEIAIQVDEINKKLTPKKIYIQKRKPCDTLRIDASIRLENK